MSTTSRSYEGGDVIQTPSVHNLIDALHRLCDINRIVPEGEFISTGLIFRDSIPLTDWALLLPH